MVSPVAPTIDATGITVNSFSTIYEYLTGQYQAIFGADAYQGNDSQDGQLIGVVSQGFADINAAIGSAYNSYSPTTAQGNGLSSIVKTNGLKRGGSSYSTATVTLTGNPCTITNGVVADTAGNLWSLPQTVTIPQSGTVSVTATCQTAGAIAAAIGAISTINTAVYGWQTVTNAAAAVPGVALEQDAALRVRQSNSVALPSQTVFDGILAAIQNVPGVTRVRPYENATPNADGNGAPPGSFYFVVEGGADAAVFNAMAVKVPPGGVTWGTDQYTYVSAAGSTKTLRIIRPTDAAVALAFTLKKLNGWSDSNQALVQTAVVNYVQSVQTDTVSYADAIAAALLQGTPQYGTFRITGVTLQKNGGAASQADVALLYNELPTCQASAVTFTLT
jgi:hypothetical protein